MTDRGIAEFNASVAMKNYGAANSGDFKNNPLAVAKFAELNEDINTLTDAGASLVSAVGTRTDGTVDKVTAKNSLYELIKSIAENARIIKKEDSTFNNTFIFSTDKYIKYQKLIEISESFKDNLTGATLAKFTEFGVSSDIAAMLQSRIDDYNAAVTEQNAGKSGGVTATAQTKAAMTRLKKNRRTLKQIGINIYINNPAKLAAWKSACRLEKTAAPPTPPTPPQP